MSSNISDAVILTRRKDDFRVTMEPKVFDFSLIFEQSILSILPSTLFIFIALFQICCSRHSIPKSASHAYLLPKLAVSLALVGLNVAACILWTSIEEERPPTAIAASTLAVGASLALTAVVYSNHRYAVRASGSVTLYLTCTVLFDAAQVRTLFLEEHHTDPIARISAANVGFKVILLLLDNFNRRSSLQAPYNTYNEETLIGPIGYSLLYWLNGLFKTGWRKVMTVDDLYQIDSALSSQVLLQRIGKEWDSRARPQRRHTLPWTIFRCFKKELVIVAIPRICLIGFYYAQPFIISRALSLLSAPQSQYSDTVGYGLIGATFLTYTGIAIATVHYRHRFFRVITMFRGAMVGLIYRHVLCLQDGVSDHSSAITLMSTDIESIIEALQEINEIWARLIEVAIGLWLLARQLGGPCAVPVILVLLCAAGQSWVSNRIGPSMQKWNEAIQHRVSMSSSMISSMKAIKMMGWVNVLANKVQALRVHEIILGKAFMRNILYLNVFAQVPEAWAPVLTFIAFTLQANATGDDRLNVTKAFTSLAVISLLIQPAGNLLVTLPKTAAAMGAFSRIQEFLLLPTISQLRQINSITTDVLTHHLDNDAVELLQLAPKRERFQCTSVVKLESITVSPSPTSSVTLRNVTADILSDSLVCVVGPVGSGKTTLIRTLLKELEATEGRVLLDARTVAYCAQSPWLKNATIIENVCNLQPSLAVDERWYRRVMFACALDEDVAAFENGDNTVIGSGGISLSGGQQQRLAIARALYSRADLMIFDDVLSALDSKTAEKLILRLFGANGLLKEIGSTTVISTHSTRVLHHADTCILVDADHIVHQGSLEDLLAHGLVDQAALISNDKSTPPIRVPVEASSALESVSRAREAESARRMGDFSTIAYYARSIGRPLIVLFIIINSLLAFVTSFPQVWLKLWVDAKGESVGLYLPVYVLLAAASTFLMGCAIWVMFLRMMPKSAATLHQTLLTTVLDAPLSFFTSTDLGETLNRFSQDMSLVDLQLPIGLSEVAMHSTSALAQAALIAVGSGYMAITLPLVLIALYFIQKIYLRTSKQLRLLDLEEKAPLYSQFVETLDGVATIRAFGWQERSMLQLLERLDRSQRPYYLLFCAQRWLQLVLDLLVAALAVCVVTLATQLRHNTDPGLLGVALNNVLGFNQTLSKLVTSWTLFEISLGAIFRVESFASDTKSEHQPQESLDPPDEWPSKGEIEIKGLEAGYAKGKSVISNVSMTIASGQTIGICGRTGSGKSSLLAAVLGLVNVSAGSITIDGINICRLNRNVVRERLAAVPQSAFVLSGSVRFNADPNGRCTDAAIIEALEKTKVWKAIEARGGLDAELSNQPLSQGQLQLFCLARALIDPSPVVLLDEATSNIDHNSDQQLQQVLKKEFKDRVVIMVAHRIETILDADMIAVLDQGRLREFDNPSNLLARDSLFKRLKDSS